MARASSCRKAKNKRLNAWSWELHFVARNARVCYPIGSVSHWEPLLHSYWQVVFPEEGWLSKLDLIWGLGCIWLLACLVRCLSIFFLLSSLFYLLHSLFWWWQQQRSQYTFKCYGTGTNSGEPLVAHVLKCYGTDAISRIDLTDSVSLKARCSRLVVEPAC